MYFQPKKSQCGWKKLLLTSSCCYSIWLNMFFFDTTLHCIALADWIGRNNLTYGRLCLQDWGLSSFESVYQSIFLIPNTMNDFTSATKAIICKIAQQNLVVEGVIQKYVGLLTEAIWHVLNSPTLCHRLQNYCGPQRFLKILLLRTLFKIMYVVLRKHKLYCMSGTEDSPYM